MQKFHIGVVGAGLIARDHLFSLSRLPEVVQLSVFDEQPEQARKLADEFGGRVCNSLDELAADCDILWICTPPFVRREPILAACRFGKALFCEKPLALHGEEIAELEAAVERAGISFFMGQSNRFLSVFQKLKELVDEGAIGEVMSIWSTRLGWLNAAQSPPWRLDDSKGGGVVVELGVHEIDYSRWIGGDWQSVYARGTSQIIAPGRFLEAVSAIGVLKSGATMHLELSWSNPRYLWQRGVDGTEGSLFFDDSCLPQIQIHRPNREPEIVPTGGWQDSETKENLSLREQAKAVLKALGDGSTPPVALSDGKSAVEIALAIRESAQSGKIVPLHH